MQRPHWNLYANPNMNINLNVTRRLLALAAAALLAISGVADAKPAPSVARQWNDLLLEAIRGDLARPTVHARNLFHTSIAMWDAWAAYDEVAATYLHHEKLSTTDAAAARAEAISFAAYRILSARFAGSPGADQTLPALDAHMDELGYDRAFTDVTGTTPAALGNRIAKTVLTFGATDGANEAGDYANLKYEPVNLPLLPAFAGNPDLADPNRWQPLALEFFVDQSGNISPDGTPEFLGPEWGAVTPFALGQNDRAVYHRDQFDYVVYHDPGAPPLLGDPEYQAGFLQVVEWSSLLDPSDGEMIDISPGARGDNTLGTNNGNGRALNPVTGMAYAPQVVPAGDYYRVLAEFWADGPDSETPPGHWFVLANYVSDHPDNARRIGGLGEPLDPLEWDVKLYLALGGAVHDAAVAAWGVKGWYDYSRPSSAIRAMTDRGQSSDPEGPSYHADGIPLLADVVEVITAESVATGERHAHLAGAGGANVGKIAFSAWRGPRHIIDAETTTAGVGWILAEDWWPYQRPSFVTPPFAGYVSGHSTYSRAAAEVLTEFTGSDAFPGGLGEFVAPQNEFLVFEDGPSMDITLQWATYYDAADECSLSRIYGGIHPRADDIPGRLMGAQIGPDAVAKALSYFRPEQTITIARAAARRGRRGGGTVTVTGRVSVADGGNLDASSGLSLAIGYGAGQIAAGRLTDGECRMTRRGTIRGRARDRSVRVSLRPLRRSPGEYLLRATLRVADLGLAVDGPLTIQLGDALRVRGGRIEDCESRAAGLRLRCR